MSEFLPESVYKELTLAGDDYYDKQAAHKILELGAKQLLEQVALNARRQEKCSMAEAKSIAISCSEYRDNMLQVIEAERVAGRARVRYDATQKLWEARRTQEATHRATMRTAT